MKEKWEKKHIPGMLISG